MKTRRSDRLIDMTRYLLERPHTLISRRSFPNDMNRQNHQSVKIWQSLNVLLSSEESASLKRFPEQLEERGLSRLFRKKRHVRLSMT